MNSGGLHEKIPNEQADHLSVNECVINSLDILRISGQKKLGGVVFYKVRWDCCEANEDSWFSETRLVTDIGKKPLNRMVSAFIGNI
jgi:hypothetical protein